ncbi:MAG: hypothetical protein HQM02_01125 [Magnetococcales bacterium]|nr:hypothetical protein [Magnetococcales bacterium]
MTPEQHDLSIDLLFKRINLRGEPLMPKAGDGMEIGRMRPERGGSGRSGAEHPDLFREEPKRGTDAQKE